MKKLTAKLIVWISLAICLVSFIGASIVQTNFGKTEITELTFEGASGHTMNALLLVPENATPATPAPAIVCSHGWYNNKEMQDLNYVEYARRGYVVLSISMYGHGDSDDLPNGDWWKDESYANGMYDAVIMISQLPYVDASRIGVTGHSNGALASRYAMLLDNKAEKPLIAAALLVSNDSVYYDADNNFANPFGSRDVGIVACQYDEFFHRVPQEDGTRSAPRDYIHQKTAQSFLNFGVDPAGLEELKSYEYYTQDIDGEEAIRVIYNPAIIHPMAHWTTSTVASSVEFFDKAFGEPIKLDSNDQIWVWKAVFNGIGVVGFFLFLGSFAIVLSGTKFFSAVKAEKEPTIAAYPGDKVGKAWYWGGMGIATIFSVLCYTFIYSWCNANRPAFFNQAPPYFIGMWSLLCGLFILIIMALSYNFYGKKHGVNLRENGALIGGCRLLKSLLLGVVVACAGVTIVYFGEFFFKADFRIFCITIRASEPAKFIPTLKYLIFFLVYYVAMSISVNSFNYVGKKSWGNTLIQMGSVALSPFIMICAQYHHFHTTGYLLTETLGVGGSITGIWLFPVLFFLPVGALLSRMIYKKTGNPYIGGVIMAIVVTLGSCANTLTLL